MIALLIGILTLFQPQSNLADTVSCVSVLHDSLTVQDGEVLYLSDLDGWEFTTDNIEDSMASVRWVRLEQPVSNQDAFPDSLWNGFGYFRLKFKVDSTFSNKEAFLRFSSSSNISAEIYLNDESVLKIGHPSRDKESEEIVARYAGMGQSITLNPDTEYVLVVKKSYHRYSLYRALTFQTFNKPYSFSLSLASPDYVQTNIERSKVNILIAGISVSLIFILSVLHLILYFRVKDQKENLWLVLLMVSIGGIALNWFLYQFTIHSFWLSLGFDMFLQEVVGSLAFSLVPLVTHKLLKVKAHVFWKAYAVVGTVLFYTTPGNSELWFFSLVFISLAGGMIGIYRAFKQGVSDTFIPAVSILGLPLVLIGAFIFDYFGFLGVYFVPVITLFYYNILPVGLSIYQGKKFLRLNTEMEDLVTERTTQLEIANQRLEESLSDLKATQSQLIQSEKMASLGELTAGIAHEIQNPLNFVNNFSEVSNELIDEMTDEFKKGDLEEGFAIADDLKQNLEKITHHGKRADAIVKGMLAHSRSGSGEKVPTNINALADEYLRLSYHGLRARDKSFNADFSTNLDPNLPKVKVAPQDMGRVLLNLFNNAFQAVNGIENPKVEVSTKPTDKGIEITVQDNGPGIPEQIRDKIFQPFFTTKPTGQGTGLGLSLSYDIIKAHGGDITIESTQGEGTKFMIILEA